MSETNKVAITTEEVQETTEENEKDVDPEIHVGRAWKNGPVVDLNHILYINKEFRRRETAVEYIRARMKYKSLPGYELRQKRDINCSTRLLKFARTYLRCCPCIQATLSDAVWDGDIIIVGELLLLKQSPDTRDEFGQLVLSIAIQQRQDHIAKFLIDQGADINLCDQKNEATPLNHAIMMGNKSIARRLIELDAELGLADNEGFTPMLWATVRGYLEVIALLIDKGADPNHQDNYGWSVMHIACFKGYIEIVDYLLTLGGVSITLVDRNGFLPKLYAEIEENLEIVELLEKYEAETKTKKKKKKKK